MAYVCPRCGGKVSRGYSRGAQMTAGLVGAAFYAAFGPFQCVKCGRIPKSEFPADVQARMVRGTGLLILAGLAALALVIWLFSLNPSN